jgi:hypothetical protein
MATVGLATEVPTIASGAAELVASRRASRRVNYLRTVLGLNPATSDEKFRSNGGVTRPK